MTAERPAGRVRHIMLNVGTGVVFLVIVVLLLMWLAGAFHRKIDDASAAAAEEIAVGDPLAMPFSSRCAEFPCPESSPP